MKKIQERNSRAKFKNEIQERNSRALKLKRGKASNSVLSISVLSLAERDLHSGSDQERSYCSSLTRVLIDVQVCISHSLVHVDECLSECLHAAVRCGCRIDYCRRYEEGWR